MSAHLTRACWFAVVALFMTLSVRAHAAEHPAFDEAMQLMRERKFEQACPKLEIAVAEQPTMIYRFRLAECYEETGKLAKALESFRIVAGEAALKGMADREAFAKKRASELEPRVPKLKLIVPPEVGAISALQINLDGVAIARERWGEANWLDLGPHELVVSGPSYTTWKLDFSLESEREIRTIQIPNQTQTPQPVPAPTTPLPEPDETTGGVSAQMIAGIVVLVVGVGLMATGVGLGVSAKNQFDDSVDTGCTGDLCSPESIAMQESAETDGNVATVLFVIGAAATVGGAVLWILAPSEDEAGPAVSFGVSPHGAILRGTF